MIVTIELKDLGCVDPSRSEGIQPYLWGVLLQVDDDTINSGALVAIVSFAPSPVGAFVPIASAMHAGDSAPIPGLVSRYGARFRSGQNRNDLILVVVLWDARDTPVNAVIAGYDAFLSEIREAIAANLPELSTATEDQTSVIEAKIIQRVRDRVESAIKGQLSDLQKVEVELGTLTLDQPINSAFRHVSIKDADSTESFTLPFSDILNDDFNLHAGMTVTSDPCEDQLARISLAQHSIENTRGALKQLFSQPESPKIEKEIETLENELLVQQARLAQAQHDLEQCRIANPGTCRPDLALGRRGARVPHPQRLRQSDRVRRQQHDSGGDGGPRTGLISDRPDGPSHESAAGRVESCRHRDGRAVLSASEILLCRRHGLLGRQLSPGLS